MNLIRLSGGKRGHLRELKLGLPSFSPPFHLPALATPWKRFEMQSTRWQRNEQCHLIRYRLLNTSSKYQRAGQWVPTAQGGWWDGCGCQWQPWWWSQEAWLHRTHATVWPSISFFKTMQSAWCLHEERGDGGLKGYAWRERKKDEKEEFEKPLWPTCYTHLFRPKYCIYYTTCYCTYCIHQYTYIVWMSVTVSFTIQRLRAERWNRIEKSTD